MSKVKKSVILLVVFSLTIVIGVSLLSGCTDSNSTQTTETTKNQQKVETTEAPQEADTTVNAASSSKKFGDEALVLTGSTTLLEVAQMWAESFMNTYGGKITVNGGGSGEGIASLLNGTTDLANASRAMKDDEQAVAKESGKEIKEYVVLYDGICIITSKNIDVKELSIQQLADIYMGKITNWKEVGGPDADIVAAARDTNSGTGEYFLERVIQKDKTEKDNDYSELCLRLQSNSDVVNQVVNSENAIGYIGIGYLKSAGDNANLVAVKDNNSEAILPSIETVSDKTYPISRELYIYGDLNSMSEIANVFMEFVLSPEGQAIGQEAGFVKVK